MLALLAALPALLAAAAAAVQGPAPTGHHAGVAAPPPRCNRLPRVDAPRARANDNRSAAGAWQGDTLVISLVATPAAWYPEADDGCAFQVLAFAEAGKQPSVPGPLIRVRAGTAVRVSVRNAAGRTLWVRGFHDRPVPAGAGVELPADSVREFRFTATGTGNYAYGATLAPFPAGGAAVRPGRDDSQLLGALVVDPAGAGLPKDRILVLTRWTLRDPRDSTGLGGRHLVTAVNGKSWPHTEQLSYQVGDSIHWRVINGSALPHPMHLHGFYFQVERKGTLTGDTALARPRIGVTELLTVGQTMQLSWQPDRPGNWLFHCHLLVHMSPAQRLDRLSDSASATLLGVSLAEVPRRQEIEHSPMNHATEGMAGLIVGVRVLPVRGTAGASARMPAPRRMLRLFANQRPGVFENGAPGYGFVLQEGSREPARDSVPFPGSTIVLRRGEPAQITVFNRLMVPLSVHWHGLELESYFDGVGDWSGAAGSIARPIAPGDSFVVRITPPRAGTFMYHVHSEEGRELASGLYGAFIVVEGRASLDALADRVLVISDGGPLPTSGAFVNGSTAPALSLTAGKAHRLRVIGITSNATREVSILQGADTASWRLLAHDGAELLGPPEPLTRALRLVGPGVTADYELPPAEPGELTLRVISRGPGGVVRQALMIPITITAPRVSLGVRQPPGKRLRAVKQP